MADPKRTPEALLNTLLQNDKSKDTLKARQDLETLIVQKELWLVKKPNGSLEKPQSKVHFHHQKARKCFCKFIKGVRLPDGFGSNFKQKVTADDNNITGMKSHDCGPSLQVDVSIERYMKKLKNYVQNKAKLEGSIAEGYVAEEALTLCSRYLKDDVETRFNRLGRNDTFLPEEEPNNSEVFRPEVDADILAFTEKNRLITWKRIFPRGLITRLAFVYPRSHGWDAGGTPPRRAQPALPAPGSNQRNETGMVLKEAFKDKMANDLLTIGFDYGDLVGRNPKAYKAHIFPTLESYFDLASWYNNQDKVVMGNNVYTVGDRVKLGLQLKLRILWRKNKQRIKADHFTRLVRPRSKESSATEERGPQAFPNVISREELDRILRQKDQEAELLRKQTAEAQQRAYLAALKADAAYQNSETMYGAIGEYFSNYAPNPTRPFMPPAFARPTMPQLSPEWAHLLNPPFPYNQPLQPSYAGPSQYTGPPGYTGPPRYTAPLQPLQPPYVGQFPFTPVNNNTFNNCYNPVMNSNLASTSNSRPELPRFIINPHNNDTRSVDELARDRELAGEDNDVGDNEEADSQQSSGDYSEDEEGDNEEVQDESEESD
ncbi:hypothetical protein Tco_0619613 [Tanacetum coccineum]